MSRIRTVACILWIASVWSVCVAATAAPVGRVTVEPQRDAELDAVLTAAAQSQLDRLTLMEGQRPGGRVSASMDIANGVITVQFGSSFLPEHYGAAFEDQHDGFSTGLSYLANKVAVVHEVRFLYDGRPIEDYFPEAGEGSDAYRRLHHYAQR